MPAEARAATAEKEVGRASSVKKAICDLPRDMVDKILALIPDKVAEHLGNSKKELLYAVTALIEDEISRTDALVKRTKDAKNKKK